MSLRDEILGYDDLAREPVLIPEWGNKTVYVRIMTGAERDWLDAASLDEQGSPLSVQERLANYRGRLVALTTCHQAVGVSVVASVGSYPTLPAWTLW